ncbi:MAG: hydrogenase maturation protease [Pirellulaceae bacterium]
MATGDLIIGIGSPHGDDVLGWLAVDRLADKLDSSVRLARLREPVDLTFHLEDCRRLWILDGCRSGSPPGSVFRLVWPDQRVDCTTSPSSHALQVDAALHLAEALGRLPARVVIFTVEVADWRPGAEVSAEVEAALSLVESRVSAEVLDGPLPQSA